MDFLPKCVVVGESGTGKTTLINALNETQDPDERVFTISSKAGAIVDMEIIELNNETITDGDNRNFLMRGDAYVFVYSITSQSSFEFVKEVMESLKKRQKKRKMKFIIVANKSDLNDERVISKEQGTTLASQFAKSIYIETCATARDKSPEVFARAADIMNSSPGLQTDVGCACSVC